LIYIRILGPFELTVNDRSTVTLSAPKLRRVLMLLVLFAGRAVRTDQFMSELWEDCPPASAHTTLQTYIYQLRKLFDRVAETSGLRVRLETTTAGYLLRLPNECVDAHCFEALVAKGRTQLADGETQLGVETLGKALALWHATSMAEADVGPILMGEVVRLEELRRAVVEERIEAELVLGRHHHVVGELLGLVAANPMHEGLQAKLILALYRSGRRSDALAAYQSARSALAGELGLEPGTELQRVHSRILAADPSLDLPEGPSVVSHAAPLPAPSQLPPDAWVVGRDAQLVALHQALEASPRVGRPVVVLTGAPGSGKTALCVHTAHQVRGNYPDGQLWAQLTTPDGHPVPPGGVLGDFLRAVGIAASRIPDDVDERARMFRSWAVDRRVLVVLDDVVRLDQMVLLLPGGSSSATLLTCRRRLSDPRITATVATGPLSYTAAWLLLASVVGEARLISEVESVTEVIQLCEGLPGALQAVVRQLELRPHWPVARMLRNPKSRSVPTWAPGPVHLDVVPVVRRSYRLLTPSAQRAFRVLAMVPDRTASAKEAGALLGVGEEVAETLLEELVEVQLIDVHLSPGSEDFRYRLRPLYRAAAMALGREVGKRDPSRQADPAGY
jgi:DNA-binding SARP family transcriptional activator